MHRLTLALLGASLLLAAPRLVHAEYGPTFEAGYTAEPAPATDQTVITDAGQLAQARAASGAQAHIEGLIELRPASARHYMFTSALEGGADSVTEELLHPLHLNAKQVVPAVYGADRERFVLGLGDVPADWDPTIRRSAIFCYLVESTGSYSELARHALETESAGEAYVLDLTDTGRLTIALPWATGAGGGGGVEVVTLEPDGALTGFGPKLDEFTLPAQDGGMELADLNHDGAWQILTSQPLLCNPCGYDIGLAWTYDASRHDWVEDERRFPKFYAPQVAFYTKLLKQVKLFMQHPARFEHKHAAEPEDRYTCTIDGEEQSLWPFAPAADGSRDDAGMWLDILQKYVDGTARSGRLSPAPAPPSH